MDQSPQIWSTQAGSQDVAGDLQKKMSVAGQLDCPICYSTYDNVFKTPKLLECGHTFCLECLSRLMAVVSSDHDDNGGSTRLLCPLCRHPTTLPQGGPPALVTNHELLCKLPGHQQEGEPVWLEGEKLCYKSSRRSSGSGAPESPTAFCICIDIGANKSVDTPIQPQAAGLLDRLADWKRMLLFVLLMVLLIVVVLWPLQCVFSSGNLRCMRDPIDPSPSPSTAFTTFSRSTGPSE